MCVFFILPIFLPLINYVMVLQRENNRKGTTSSSEHEGPKTPDPKVN